MNISKLLRAWRCHERLSVEDAARRIGIPWNSYRSLENDKGIRGVHLVALWRWLMDVQ
jgi:cytoskeletal protein RodZ